MGVEQRKKGEDVKKREPRRRYLNSVWGARKQYCRCERTGYIYGFGTTNSGTE